MTPTQTNTVLTHFIPVDFNHDSLCGLSKAEWQGGTNNWDWVTCPACLERRPKADSQTKGNS